MGPSRQSHRRFSLPALSLAIAASSATLLAVGDRAAAIPDPLPYLTDFDGDGFGDFVIGQPGASYAIDPDGAGPLTETRWAGAVHVIPGSAAGPSTSPSTSTNINQLAYDGDLEDIGKFGYVLTTGDFNDDGFSDLVVGIPDKDVPAEVDGVVLEDAGMLHVIYGKDDAGFTFTALAVGNDQSLMTRTSIGLTSNSFDRFGESLTSGDFNGDGYDDIAVGIPLADTDILRDSGAVDIIYGAPTGLDRGKDATTVNLSPSDQRRFGSSLTTGDFDDDGRDDLAIGGKGSDSAGTVDVILGAASGISATNTTVRLAAGVGDLTVPAGSNTGFGAALTTGDFDDDGHDDLAIGAPFADVLGVTDGGVVQIVYGNAAGLALTDTDPGLNPVLLTESATRGNGATDTSDQFGRSLVSGYLDDDDFADLVVGIPGDGNTAGAFVTIFGSAGGLVLTGSNTNTFFNQDYAGGFGDPQGGVETGDRFGRTLAVNDYNGDGYTDVAIGAPRESIGSQTNAPFWPVNGSVHIMYGTADGLRVPGNYQYYHGHGVAGSGAEGNVLGAALGGQATEELWNTPRSGPIGPVRNATTTAGDEQLRVRWSPPIDRGGVPLSYRVAWATPGQPSGEVTVSNGTQATITGLTNDADYEIAITPFYSTSTGQIAATGGTPKGTLRPVVPARLLETRKGADFETIDGQDEGRGRATAGSVTAFDVTGRGGVDDDAESVILNVVAVRPSARGYLTVFPCGSEPPQAANLNYEAGTVTPNAAFAKIGIDGQVCIFSLAATDLVVDVNGYVPAGSTPTAIAPLRVLETRTGRNADTFDGQFLGDGPVQAGDTVEIPVVSRVPSVGIDSVFINVAAVNPLAAGFLTVYPCGDPVPKAASLNYRPGGATPNAVLAPFALGSGAICIYTSATTDLVVDLNGSVSATGATGSLSPARLLETRDGPTQETVDHRFEGEGRVTPGSTTELFVATRGGVDADARAVILNVAAVRPSAAGYLTIYPCTDKRPKAANLNFVEGDVVPNFVLAKVGTNGKVCIYSTAETDLVVDVNGQVSQF